MSKKLIIAIIVAVLGIGGFTGYHIHVKNVENQRIIQLLEEEKAAREKAEKEKQEADKRGKEKFIKQLEQTSKHQW